MFTLPQDYQVAVIGGAGDIGRAITRAFVGAGARVVATGHSDAEIAQSGLAAVDGVEARVLDITDDAAVAAFAKGFDRLDALVNCAGILFRFQEYEIETFKKVLDVNLIGAFRTCSAFHDLLAAAKGSIVNIASMNAFAGLPFIPAYCASKGGLVMLTKSLSLAWANDGIRVNAVAPGYVETRINAKGRADKAFYDKIADRTALKRWAKPDDIAGSVVFLCTPAAAYITGTVLPVDGGFLAG